MLALTALLCTGPASAASAQADTPPRVDSLADAWLAYNARNDDGAPLYSFISLASTRSRATDKRKAIREELDNIDWRLENTGRVALRQTLQRWRQALSAVDSFRFPGRWDLASVLSRPLAVPPIERVATIGDCPPPEWIEVWDSRGVNRYRWQSNQSLSSLLNEDKLDLGQAGRVAVVTPSGSITHFGLQAWNFTDATLVPGMRIIASLPLKGQAFPWLRDATARFLSYVPPGDGCTVVSLNHSDARP